MHQIDDPDGATGAGLGPELQEAHEHQASVGDLTVNPGEGGETSTRCLTLTLTRSWGLVYTGLQHQRACILPLFVRNSLFKRRCELIIQMYLLGSQINIT